MPKTLASSIALDFSTLCFRSVLQQRTWVTMAGDGDSIRRSTATSGGRRRGRQREGRRKGKKSLYLLLQVQVMHQLHLVHKKKKKNHHCGHTEGETKNWDVNVEDFNLEEDNELEGVNSSFEEPSIPASSTVQEEQEEENDFRVRASYNFQNCRIRTRIPVSAPVSHPHPCDIDINHVQLGYIPLKLRQRCISWAPGEIDTRHQNFMALSRRSNSNSGREQHMVRATATSPKHHGDTREQLQHQNITVTQGSNCNFTGTSR
ncbi:hypothetical protein EJ110_NYTH19343 [Nymphaea thermarum]|nr:hypothetical protein EJ110_NYTH19343 [Nymphaea thermarum]